MKKLIGIILLTALTVASYAGTMTINGTVTGKNFFQSVSLYLINNDFVTTASIAPDGKFTISTAIDKTESYYFLFTGTNGLKRQMIAVLSPGDKINMTIESTYAGNTLTEVTGSQDMSLIKHYFEKQAVLAGKLSLIESAFETADAADRPRLQQQYRTEYQQYVGELEALLIKNKTLLSSILIEYAEFSKEAHSHKAVFKELFESLKAKYGQTLIMKEVEAKMTNPIEVGKIAPEIVGVGPDGKSIKLSSLRGKYVLIDFWASWCRPCRGENPNVVEAYNKYKAKKFDVFSVSLDADSAGWVNAIAADGLIWKNHVCSFKRWNCPIAKSYRVNSIPFSVLIDPKGVIIATHLRGEALQEKLAEVLNNNKK